MQLYPNPTSNHLTIEYNLPTGVEQGEIIIHNMAGKKVESISVGNHFKTVQIDVSNYGRGVYIASLNGKRLKKIVVN